MLIRAYAIIAALGSLLAPAAAFAGDNITIQGRIVNPAGNPVTGASTQFRVQILSPDAARCILYDETRTVDLSNSSGLFSLNIADGTGTRAAPLTYSLEQAISNRVDLTVDGAYCAGPGSSAGTPVAYHPLAQHNRKIVIQFRDPGTMGSAWETIPEMDLNPVPYAIDSRSVGGYASSAFLKVVDGGVPGTPAAMTTAQFTELGRLISGTSDNYMSGAATSTNGARLPSYAGNPSAPAAGSIWFDSGSGTVKYSTGSGPPLTIGASSGGSSAVVSSVAGGDGIAVTGSGALTVSLAASGVGAGDTKGSATMVPRITYDTYGRITAIVEQAIGSTLPSAGADHQVLMSNSGSWGASYIGLSDLRKDAGTPLFPGTCATNRTLNWNSVSGVFECVDLGSIASSQLAAPSGAATGTYRSVSVNAAGQVLSGTNPTTLGGYFISDAVRNGGSVPQIRSGAADPSGAGVDGELYVATTSQKIFRYNLGTTTWETMASAGGAGGTMTGINAGTGISVTGSATTPTVGLSSAGVVSGSFAKVTTDTYGRVTSGAAQVGDADISDLAFAKLTGKPTTLAGHGITEALVANAGGAASLQAGPTGSRPTPGTVGQIYIDTDTNTVYYRGASAWQTVASAAGSGGTLTDVLSGAGVSVTGTGATRTVSLPDVGTASSGLIKVNTDAKGRVTGGATTIANADITDLAFSKLTGTPTTVGGYGITDAVKNPDGSVPTILSGNDTAKPPAAAGNLNFIYIANDTFKIYRQIGGTWQVIGAATPANFSGSLAGEVSGTQGATQLDKIGTFLRATILGYFTDLQNATDAKSNGALVKRDGSGGLAAGAVTADSVVFKGSTSGTATLRAPAAVTTYDVQLPASAPAPGQVLSASSGTALSWTTPLSGSTITVAAPVTNTSGTIGINTASGSQAGALSSTDWTTFNNKLGTALTAASIWVGNASNVATAVAPSGDVAMTNAGAFTVNGIKGQAISAAGASAGQVLRYAGANTWTPNFVGIRDLRSNITGSTALSTTCTAAQTLTWDSAGDNLTCQNISIAAATQLTGVLPIASGGTGTNTTSQGFVFAGPSSGSGAPAFRALAASDLAGLANQWSEGSGNVFRLTGNVGIGTSSPGANLDLATLRVGRTAGSTTEKLDISVSDRRANFVMAQDGVAEGGYLFDLSGDGSGSNLGSFYVTRKSNLADTPSNTLFTIKDNGTVGIGTTAPSHNLDVAPADNTTGRIRISNTGTGTNSVRSFIEATGARADGNSTFGGRLGLSYRRTDGTAIATNTIIGSVGFGGQHGTSNTFQQTNLLYPASIDAVSEGSFTNATTMPTALRFLTGSTGQDYGAANVTYGTERMRIDSSGNVGIGSASPTAKLDVNGAVRATSFIGPVTAASASNSAGYTINSDSDAAGADGGVSIQVRGTTKLAVTDAGRISVGGEATPVSQLANTATNSLDQAGTGSSADSLTWLTNVAGYVASFANSSAATNANGLYVKTTGTAATNRILNLNANGTDVMVVTGAGRVGIGTTTPSKLMHVRAAADQNLSVTLDGDGGDSGAATLMAHNDAVSSLTPLAIGASRLNIYGGNVGVGTNAPNQKFEVYGNGATIGQRAATSAGAGSVWAQANDYYSGPTYRGTSIMQYGSAATGTTSGINNTSLGVLQFQNSSAGMIRTNGGSPLIFSTLDTERMRILSSGNVGIGTNAPTVPLEVNGAIKSTSVEASGTVKAAAIDIPGLQSNQQSRNIPTTVGDAVDIGTYGLLHSAQSFLVSVTTSTSGFSVTKNYLLSNQHCAANCSSTVWYEALPLTNSGPYGTNDFALDLRQSNTPQVLDLRLRRVSGATAATAVISIQNLGYGSATFTASSATASVTSPTSYYASTVLTQISGRAGIGVATPAVKLHVYEAAPADASLRIENGNLANTSGVDFYTAGTWRGFFGWRGASSTALGTAPLGLYMWNRDNSHLVLGTDNTERMRITSSGSVGIGTTNPGYPLDVTGTFIRSRSENYGGFIGQSYGTTVGPEVILGRSRGTIASPTYALANDYLGALIIRDPNNGANSAHITSYAPEDHSASSSAGDLRFSTTPAGSTSAALRMVITPAGNVGIANASPGYPLDVGGVVRSNSEFISTSGGTSQLRMVRANYGTLLRNDGSDFYILQTASGDQYGTWTAARPFSFNLTSGNVSLANNAISALNGGNVGIGTTNPGYRLEVAGTTANDSGAWAVRSDARLKKDVAQLNDALDRVLKLRGVSFRWKDEKKNKAMGLQRGFIAQEVEKVIPEWVHKGNDGFLHLEKVGIEAYFVESIKQLYQRWFDRDQEIRREVASLAKDNQALKQENELLKKQDAKKTTEIEAMKSRLDRLEKLLPAR